MTDLVFASKEDFSGLLSLRANMDTSGDKPEMKVKAFTMEKPKTMADTLYLYRQPITSEKVKEALLATGEWLGPDGKKTIISEANLYSALRELRSSIPQCSLYC